MYMYVHLVNIGTPLRPRKIEPIICRPDEPGQFQSGIEMLLQVSSVEVSPGVVPSPKEITCGKESSPERM